LEPVAADGFDYNPDNPVPTLGGQVIGIPDCPPGPVDQRPLERRDDVLVYRGEALAEPLTVVGHVRAVLHASSSAADTDFTARLVDVQPDGRALILTEGIVRARYRRGFKREEMLEPGKVYAFTIEVGALAHTFLPGHRVQLDVSSSNFPRFDQNLNTGEPLATGSRMEVAHQSVYHDRKHPSHLVLPVVPSAPLRGKARARGERRGGA
jgi:putative CocE/NonD family hydrolase